MIDGFIDVVSEGLTFFIVGDIFVIPYTHAGTAIACNISTRRRYVCRHVNITVYAVLSVPQEHRRDIDMNIGCTTRHIHTTDSYENVLYAYVKRYSIRPDQDSLCIWQRAYNDIIMELY